MSDFNLADLDAQDEATLVIKHPKTLEPTGWTWTFYGPGHPRTITLADRVSREALKKSAARLQAKVNGKKWKEEEQEPDELRAENADNIVSRTKSFSDITLNGEKLVFGAERARALLLDRKKGWLLEQIMEFLSDQANFIQPSAKT